MITIKNKHTENCGEMPRIWSDRYEYVGYFQNQHGEQLVFTKLAGRLSAELRLGDAGWSETYKVTKSGLPDGLVLSEDEQTWLWLCIGAARL